MNLTEKQARYTLARTPGIGVKKFQEIIQKYSSVENYLKIIGVKSFDTPPANVIVFGEDEYPYLVKQVADPPALIFYNGNSKLLNSRTVSIVGTRFPSTYGIEVTKMLVEYLVEQGITTVSGFARGIDYCVHDTTLKSGGKTIAVLPNSINNPYPLIHLKLFNELSKENLIISEFNENKVINKGLFPRRNRIIAALSPVTIVIEAPFKSGALITAKLAFDYNRQVLALPGRIDSPSIKGNLQLIKDGIAEIFTSFSDIDSLQLSLNLKHTELSKNEEDIVNLFESGVNEFDDLANAVKIAPAELALTLSQLELKGYICKDTLGVYQISNNK